MRAEVVADDRDPDGGRVKRAQVAAELQEPGPVLAWLDVPVQLVLAQLIGGEQVPHPGGAGIGGALRGRGPGPGSLFLPLTAAHCRPGCGCRFSGPNSSTQKITSGSPGSGIDLAVGDRIQVLDPGLLHRVVRVGGGLPGFQPLKGDALLTEQHPQALMADVVDHPLSDQELRQLRQAPGRKRQAMLGGLDLAIFLTSRRCGRVNLGGRPPGTSGTASRTRRR